MQTLLFTHHAQARMQQRGITLEPTAVIQTYGTARFRDGAEVIFMDKKARKAARAAMGEKAYAKVADHLDSYLVMADDGAIVTCAHRTKRLRFKH